MDHELDYQKAPAEHLKAWNGIKKTITYSTVAFIFILLALAFFFGG